MNSFPWFVDAGFWIAAVRYRDRYHHRARVLGSGLRRPLVTTEAVLIEVGNSLSRSETRYLAIELLRAIRSNATITVVPVTSDLVVRAIDFYTAHRDKEWGLTDCISFVVMRERGLHEALAADQHFVQAGFRALLLEP